MEAIEEFAGTRLCTNKINQLLERRFGFHYDTDLLYKMVAAAEAVANASDPSGMQRLFDDGLRMRDAGGVSKISSDAWGRLRNYWRQSPEQRKLQTLYDEFLLADGTHWVNQYGQILVIFSGIDCLGKTQVFGWVCTPSEDEDVIEHACELFQFSHTGVLMTDGAPCFRPVA